MKPPLRSRKRNNLDALIHEASRLQLVAILNECEVMDFKILVNASGLSKGNLSQHMNKLVTGGYVDEKKEFIARKSHTEFRLTPTGRKAYREYLKALKRITGIDK